MYTLLHNFKKQIMKIFTKLLLYIFAIAHTPFTLLRVVVSTVIIVDGWCDKIIHGFSDTVEMELKDKK